MTKTKAPAVTGRRCLYGEAMKPRTFRLTDAQAAKVDRLGGGDWVRKQIDKAKEH